MFPRAYKKVSFPDTTAVGIKPISKEGTDLVIKGVDGAIAATTVTYDFARLVEGAKEVMCSAFGDAIIAHMA